MMTSSRDELLHRPSRGSDRHRPPAGHSRQTAGAARLLGPGGPGQHHRPAGPVGLRKDHADPQHRRHPDHRIGHRQVLGLPAGSPALRHRIGYVPQDPTIYDDLRVIDNVRYFASLYGFDSRAGGVGGRTSRARRSQHGLLRQPFRRSAHPGVLGVRVGLPAGAAGARRADGRVGSRASGRPVGAVRPSWPAAEPRCWCPAT